MVTSPAVKIPQTLKVTDEQFYQLVNANPELHMERTAEGELIVIAPTGSEGGNRNVEVSADIVIWDRQTQLGFVFDSSTGFRLPNGATRSPDTAWVAKDRWEALRPEHRKVFAPICPDFVLELASDFDSLDSLRAKMREYLANGARLGWLIDPKTCQVEIYRPDRPIEVIHNPQTLSGETVLPGFTLMLRTVFGK